MIVPTFCSPIAALPPIARLAAAILRKHAHCWETIVPSRTNFSLCCVRLMLVMRWLEREPDVEPMDSSPIGTDPSRLQTIRTCLQLCPNFTPEYLLLLRLSLPYKCPNVFASRHRISFAASWHPQVCGCYKHRPSLNLPPVRSCICRTENVRLYLPLAFSHRVETRQRGLETVHRLHRLSSRASRRRCGVQLLGLRERH